ncbi:TIGR03758 family integrating conjugative element protein [Salmonella enterica subsp. houtenae]|nr:TIGR03758 family integrating conjugative element protein [Salmonella enterica subsp. houtenae]EEE2292102.1 TIGR03758 family integrating conjugative element protein [Salmonella enterica subsp. houtenae]SUF53553.1 integrating conjugative element protein, PFL_4701 family [Salmonella enterica]
MTPEQISVFQAVSLVKPDAVSLVMLGLFSAFLLLWVVWVLNDAYRGVATARGSRLAGQPFCV